MRWTRSAALGPLLLVLLFAACGSSTKPSQTVDYGTPPFPSSATVTHSPDAPSPPPTATPTKFAYPTPVVARSYGPADAAYDACLADKARPVREWQKANNAQADRSSILGILVACLDQRPSDSMPFFACWRAVQAVNSDQATTEQVLQYCQGL